MSLLRAYRETRYAAAGITVRIGRPVPGALRVEIGRRTGVLLTAWNPQSRRMPEGWNRRMQWRLRARLRGFATMTAEGSLRSWHEDMVLAVGDFARLLRLARVFRQRAVVVLRAGAKVALHPLPARSAGRGCRLLGETC